MPPPAFSDRLIFRSSPFSPPCPWRRTLLIVPSIIANSKSGSSDSILNIRVNASARTQRRNRLNTEFELAELFRQIPPRGARARNPQYRFEKQARVSARLAWLTFLPKTMRLHKHPLGLAQDPSRQGLPPNQFQTFEDLICEPAGESQTPK